MASFYQAGWRQGTILVTPLPLSGMLLSDNGEVIQDTPEHQVWIVATQDCDLDACDASSPEDVVELRPVFEHDPPSTRGIRSRKHLLVSPRYVEAQSRRLTIAPAALTARLGAGLANRDNSIADDAARKTAFKTWLGLRYDRPAVPPEYVDLTKRIAQEIERQGKPYSNRVRDVLVQFESNDPPIYYLYAIILDVGDMEEVSKWLVDTSLRIPTEFGVLGAIDVGTDAQASLRLIETSFAVDLSQITWGGETLRGAPGRFSHPLES